MRITGSQVGPLAPAHLQQIKKTTPSASTEVTRPGDQVVLSRDISAIDAARKIIADTPDVRQEKVEALRRDIADGNYRVDPDKVAARILAEGRLSKLGRK